MSAPEVTAAVERLAKAQFHAYESEYSTDGMTVADFYPTAKADIAVVLDVEEMARAADPKAFDDHPIERRSHAAAIQWAARRKIATDHAQAIRAALLGGAA